MSIIENINNIKKSLPEGVKLIAISKTRTIDDMEEAYSCGIIDFGENKVQEMLDKMENFHEDVNWHLIGHLQRNKVKYIVGKVSLIHSLDSIRLLKEIENRYKKEGYIANVLIQINIGKEESKTGIYEEELKEIIDACEKCDNVKVKGLMCIIPKGNNEQCEYYFKKMKDMFNELKNKRFKNISMEILSMGMTNDYKIAIKEGANMVRIGQGIFGQRNYNK